MSDLGRGRKQGFIAAVVLMVAAGLAWAWHSGRQPLVLEPHEREILIRDRFVPVERVKEVVREVRVPVPIEVEKLIREVVTVEVPAAPAEVVVQPDAPCDPGPVELGGAAGQPGCQIAIAGEGVDRMARAMWTCEASGPGWTASRGPIVADEVRFQAEATKPILGRLWALEGGLWADQEDVGVRAGLARWGQGRRLGWVVGADYTLDPSAAYESYQADRWRVGAGAAVRF